MPCHCLIWQMSRKLDKPPTYLRQMLMCGGIWQRNHWRCQRLSGHILGNYSRGSIKPLRWLAWRLKNLLIYLKRYILLKIILSDSMLWRGMYKDWQAQNKEELTNSFMVWIQPFIEYDGRVIPTLDLWQGIELSWAESTLRAEVCV